MGKSSRKSSNFVVDNSWITPQVITLRDDLSNWLILQLRNPNVIPTAKVIQLVPHRRALIVSVSNVRATICGNCTTSICRRCNSAHPRKPKLSNITGESPISETFVDNCRAEEFRKYPLDRFSNCCVPIIRRGIYTLATLVPVWHSGEKSVREGLVRSRRCLCITLEGLLSATTSPTSERNGFYGHG